MLLFFINNLSYSIIDNIIFFSIIWLVYDLLKNGIQLTAQNKYILALSFLFIGTLYFWFDLFLDKQYHLILYLNTSNIFHGLHLSISSITNTVSLSNVNSIVALVYIITFILLIVKFTVQFSSLRILKNRSDFSNHKYLALLKNVVNIQLKQSLKVGFNNQIYSPIVFGILEHIILLPVSLCNQISQQELKMLLLHEYAHILRKDYLFNLIIELSGLVLWFNPFVYLFKKELNLQREIACDEYVVMNTHHPIAYSKVLLAVAENSIETNQQLSLAAHSNNTDLKTRIELINGIYISSNQKINQKRNKKFTFIAYFILIGAFFFVNAFNTTALKNTKVEEIKLVATSTSAIHKLTTLNTVSLYSSRLKMHKLEKPIIIKALNNDNKPEIENELAYSDLVNQTKNWIKSHEDPLMFTAYNENNSFNSKDSTEEVLANKLLILSIVKRYQLKKAIFDEKVKNIAKNASNQNEAMDYLLNSSEWNEMLQYEKWVHEFLDRQ